MKKLLVECYSLLFKITRAKLFSYWFALVYITILIYWAVNGLAKLTSGWLPMSGIVSKFFNFPFFIGTAAIIFGIIYKFAPDMKQISKDAKKRNGGYATIALFSLSVVILIVYMKFGDTILT